MEDLDYKNWGEGERVCGLGGEREMEGDREGGGSGGWREIGKGRGFVDWRLIDCSFGVAGLVPLSVCLRRIRMLEECAG
jgi:hypothetical protein